MGIPRTRGLESKILLKTDSGYPRDMGVTLFTLANRANALGYNTPRMPLAITLLEQPFAITLLEQLHQSLSAPPVSTLARSRGPGAGQVEGPLRSLAPQPLHSTRNQPE